MIATTSVHEVSQAQFAPPRTITLLELVSELVVADRSDRELVTTVLDLVDAGRIRLIGQVVEADLRVRV